MHNPIVTGKAWRYAFRLFFAVPAWGSPQARAGFEASFCFAAKNYPGI
jgi:hypothetical protein